MASTSTAALGAIAATQVSEDFMIKPSSDAVVLDTSKWPLLLKNYDKWVDPTVYFRMLLLVMLMSPGLVQTPRPLRSLHSHPCWLFTIEARPRELYQVRVIARALPLGSASSRYAHHAALTPIEPASSTSTSLPTRPPTKSSHGSGASSAVKRQVTLARSTPR